MRDPLIAPSRPVATALAWSAGVAILASACALALAFGKDVSWDFLNYHHYAAHALLTGRLDRDFLPAGPQSYLNPLAFVPHYLMVGAGWPDRVVVACLAAFHGLSLVALWRICLRVWPGAGALRTARVTLALALGGVSTVFFSVLGSTFADATLAVPVMFAVVLLSGPDGRSPGYGRAFAAGLLLGAAVAGKPTNLWFAAAAVVALPLASGALAREARRVLAVLLGAVPGFALAGGWWYWRVASEFGNPVFPLANRWFASPDFPPVDIVLERFRPESLQDLALLPLRMLEFHTWIHTEVFAPDARWAVLLLLGLFFGLRWFGATPAPGPGTGSTLSRPERFVGAFFLLGTLAWATTSANGRHALPPMLLAGPACLWLLGRLPGFDAGRTLTAGCVLLAVQATQAVLVENPRYGAMPWGGPWVRIEVPEALREAPHGYLSLTMQTAAFIAPYVHPDSSFSNLSGQLAVDPEGPGGARVRRLLERHSGQLRAMIVRMPGKTDPQAQRDWQVAGWILAPWGLRVDARDCNRIVAFAGTAAAGSVRDGLVVETCAVVPGPGESPDTGTRRARIARILAALEGRCPGFFGPPGFFPVVHDAGWYVWYANSDSAVYEQEGRVRYSRFMTGPFNVDLGEADAIARGDGRFGCPVRPRHSGLAARSIKAPEPTPP